jgi:hypothetical protein
VGGESNPAALRTAKLGNPRQNGVFSLLWSRSDYQCGGSVADGKVTGAMKAPTTRRCRVARMTSACLALDLLIFQA